MDPFLDAIAHTDAGFMLDTLGEPVEYRPFNGVPRTINAIVDRQPIENQGRAGPRPSIRITVSTHPVTGIDPATISFDNDKIYVQYVPGQPNGDRDFAYSFTYENLNVQTTGILEATLG